MYRLSLPASARFFDNQDQWIVCTQGQQQIVYYSKEFELLIFIGLSTATSDVDRLHQEIFARSQAVQNSEIRSIEAPSKWVLNSDFATGNDGPAGVAWENVKSPEDGISSFKKACQKAAAASSPSNQLLCVLIPVPAPIDCVTYVTLQYFFQNTTVTPAMLPSMLMYLSKVCQDIHNLHKQHIIVCELHPGNLLIQTTGHPMIPSACSIITLQNAVTAVVLPIEAAKGISYSSATQRTFKYEVRQQRVSNLGIHTISSAALRKGPRVYQYPYQISGSPNFATFASDFASILVIVARLLVKNIKDTKEKLWETISEIVNDNTGILLGKLCLYKLVGALPLASNGLGLQSKPLVSGFPKERYLLLDQFRKHFSKALGFLLKIHESDKDRHFSTDWYETTIIPCFNEMIKLAQDIAQQK
jgi:hypothetical protein